MLDTKTLQRLFKYKLCANEEILAAIEKLDSLSPAREVAIRTLSHAYVVDQIFAANMERRPHAYASSNDDLAPSLEELFRDTKASDQWYVDYVSALDRRQLEEVIDFTFTDGAPGRMSREEMLMHVSLHGAYHRGQVSWMLALNAVDPPVDGLTSYLHKAEASSRRRPEVTTELFSLDLAKHDVAETVSSNRVLNDGAAEAPTCLAEMTERVKIAVGNDAGLGKTLKFDLRGEGFILIDGSSVTNEDKPADLTLSATIDDLRAIGQGRLAPMAAVMTGRLGLSSMSVAMGLRSKMQELFVKMR
ncbi:DinB family protein [Dyella mobilis]|nr:DinB family protein [Dyella mobilis]